MSKLSQNEVKLEIIRLKEEGYTSRKIAEKVGVGKSTINDFLSKETHGRWWEKFKVFGNSPEGVQDTPVTKTVTDLSVGGPSIFKIETSSKPVKDSTHLVIPDTQCKPGISLEYLRWAGEYIAHKKPDVIVHIGDHADMESLSSYDKGKKSAEGKRVKADIDSAIEGMNSLLKPIYDLQQKELAETGKIQYKPRMVITLGNHEQRIMRHVDANPELAGFISYDNLRYKEMGWEVYDFLKPTIIDGVSYVHFMANAFTGRPYGGSASNVLKNVGESFTQGHKQTLDIATRFLPASGRQQWAIIAGAYYDHNEAYKGYQGNFHWRGLVVKHNVCEGSYNPMFVDIDYLRRRYGK